jgi:hypothetical protein
MNNRLLMSVAVAAMVAGTGLANAQAGMSREAPSSGPAAQSAPSGAPSRAPAADRAAPMERTAPVNRDEATDTSKRPEAGSDIKATQSDDKVQRDNGSQRATDTNRDNSKAGKDMKAEGREANPNAKAATDSKAAADSKSGTTTGQAGAGAKLSSEQRTKITTTIKQQNIKPVTNINFSISVGTRVPRDVSFHPLPAEIVTVYPDWRGYEFFLVRDEIIVVNPRTLEIVAVLDV